VERGGKNFTFYSIQLLVSQPRRGVIRVFYLPTDAQEGCFKDIKIYIKTVPTCFGLITIIRERVI
jgi:hypothetical protein